MSEPVDVPDSIEGYQAIMADRSGPYWNGDQSRDLQAGYMAMLEREEGEAVTPALQSQAPHSDNQSDGEVSMPEGVLEEFGEGAQHLVTAAQPLIAAIAESPGGEQFIADIDAQPEEIRSNLYWASLLPTPGHVSPADDDQVASYEANWPHLIKAWGGSASHMVGRIEALAEGVLRRPGGHETVAWFKGLSADDQTTLLWSLSNRK